MSKAVLISINPKWCELIASGKKTIEVRKTKPKLSTPFKCYIYCTMESHKGKYLHTSNKHGQLLFWDNPKDTSITVQPENYDYMAYTCRGKVTGEFVCDEIFTISVKYDNPNHHLSLREFPYTCMMDREIINYLGNGKKGYGWHISGLKIYDKPKELSEFKKINRDCWYADLGLAKRDCPECKNKNCFVQRPPQSLCYVERLVEKE